MKRIVDLLLRIGLISRHWDGKLVYPIHVSPWHWWWMSIIHGGDLFPRFAIFDTEHCARYVKGRWLPWRWGFLVLGLEIGDRGSHHAPQDYERNKRHHAKSTKSK